MKVESIFFLFPGCKNLDSCCNTEFKGTDSLSETSSSGVREVFSASVFSFQPLSKSETLSALWLSFCHSITQREYFEKMQHQKTPKILCCVFYWQNRLLLCWSLVAGAVENSVCVYRWSWDGHNVANHRVMNAYDVKCLLVTVSERCYSNVWGSSFWGGTQFCPSSSLCALRSKNRLWNCDL